MIKKEVMLDDLSIVMEKIGYGQYVLRCDSPTHPSIFCDESWIFDGIDDDENPKVQEVAIRAALNRLKF